MTPTSAIVALVSVLGAIAASATALSRPRLSLAILFLLASFSRATLETPLGTMRPEMPGVACVAAILIAGGRGGALRGLPRSTWVMVGGFGTYLGALGLSSALIAPGHAQSLRMVAWVAISMLGGVVAFMLMRRRPIGSAEPFAFAGTFMGVTGIIDALLYLAAGPGTNPGIQDPYSILPRVYGLASEANLYASFLAMCAFFALEAARRHRIAGLAMLALTLFAFPLGVTRGAYVGLAVGAIAYLAVRASMHLRLADLRLLAPVFAGVLVFGVVGSMVLLPNIVDRAASLARSGTGPSASQSTIGSPTGGAGASNVASGPASPGSGQTPAASSPTPAPTLALPPEPDTLAFRLERVPIALGDFPRSPLIGFGAESFGQEHPNRYAGSGPDHIAIMAVVVPYESGIIGATGLLVGFAVLLASLWKSAREYSRRRDLTAVATVAAFFGAMVSVLVAYQVTNSLQFAVNWMVIGAAAALVAGSTSPQPSQGPR